MLLGKAASKAVPKFVRPRVVRRVPKGRVGRPPKPAAPARPAPRPDGPPAAQTVSITVRSPSAPAYTAAGARGQVSWHMHGGPAWASAPGAVTNTATRACPSQAPTPPELEAMARLLAEGVSKTPSPLRSPSPSGRISAPVSPAMSPVPPRTCTSPSVAPSMHDSPESILDLTLSDEEPAAAAAGDEATYASPCGGGLHGTPSASQLIADATAAYEVMYGPDAAPRTDPCAPQGLSDPEPAAQRGPVQPGEQGRMHALPRDSGAAAHSDGCRHSGERLRATPPAPQGHAYHPAHCGLYAPNALVAAPPSAALAHAGARGARRALHFADAARGPHPYACRPGMQTPPRVAVAARDRRLSGMTSAAIREELERMCSATAADAGGRRIARLRRGPMNTLMHENSHCAGGSAAAYDFHWSSRM